MVRTSHLRPLRNSSSLDEVLEADPSRLAVLGVAWLLLSPTASSASDNTRTVRTAGAEGGTFDSETLGVDLVVLPGVFGPSEAEEPIFPFMRDHSDLFEAKKVLEIGTGVSRSGTTP